MSCVDAQLGGGYSLRWGVMGWGVEARRAGIRLAARAAAMSKSVTAVRVAGSRLGSLIHCVASLLRAMLRVRPTSRPAPTLAVVEARTRRKMSADLAPRAMRMPNSLVRVATA